MKRTVKVETPAFEDLTYAAQCAFRSHVEAFAELHSSKGDCGCTWTGESGDWKRYDPGCDVCLFAEVDCGEKSYEDVEAILFPYWFARLTWQAQRKAIWVAR